MSWVGTRGENGESGGWRGQERGGRRRAKSRSFQICYQPTGDRITTQGPFLIDGGVGWDGIGRVWLAGCVVVGVERGKKEGTTTNHDIGTSENKGKFCRATKRNWVIARTIGGGRDLRDYTNATMSTQSLNSSVGSLPPPSRIFLTRL